MKSTKVHFIREILWPEQESGRDSAVSWRPPNNPKIWHICDRWLTASWNGLDVIPVTLSQTVCHLVSCRVWSIPIRSWGHPWRKKVCCQWRIIICGEYSAEGHKFFKPSSLIPFSFFHFSFIIIDSIITITCINQQPLNNGVFVYFQTSGTFTIN